MARKFFIILSLAVLLHDALGTFEQRSYNPRFRNVNKKYQQTSSNGYGNGEIMEEMYLLDANTQKLTKTDVVLVSLPEGSSFTENEVADHQNEKHSQHTTIASGQRKTQKPNHSAFLEAEAGIRQSKPIVLQLLGWTGNPPPPIAMPPMPVKNSAVATSEPSEENLSVSIVFKGDNSEKIKPVSSGSLALGQDNKEKLSQVPEVVAVTSAGSKIINEEPLTLVEAISKPVLAAGVSKDSKKKTEESLTLVEAIPQTVLAVGASKDSEKETQIKNDEQDIIKTPLVATFMPGKGDLEGSIIIQEDPMEEIEPESSGVIVADSKKNNKQELSQTPEAMLVEAIENIMNEEPTAFVEALSQQDKLAANAHENLEKKKEILEVPVVAISKPSKIEHPIFIQADKKEEVKPVSSGVNKPVSMIALGEPNKQEFIKKPEIVAGTSNKNNIVKEKPSSMVEALYQAVAEAGAGIKNIEEDIMKTAVVDNSKPDIAVPIYIRDQNMEKIKPVSSGVIATESIIKLDDSKKEKLSQKPEVVVVTTIENEKPSTLDELIFQDNVASIASENAEKVAQINNVKEGTAVLPIKLESVPVKNSKKPVVAIVENEDKKEVLLAKPELIQSANLSDKNIELLVTGIPNKENASPVYQKPAVASVIVPEFVPVTNKQSSSPVILKNDAKKEVSASKVENFYSEDKKIESQIAQKLDEIIGGAPLISQVASENLSIKIEAKPDSSIIPEISTESKLPLATELKKDNIAVVESSPEKQQKITIVLPKEEQKKNPVIFEHSPIKGNDKSEVAKPLNENAVPENSLPLLSLLSKPEKAAGKPQIVQKLDEVIGGAPLISQVASENLSIKIQAKPDSSIIPEFSTESKLPLVTELKKDNIAVVESSPEKQQKLTIVLPKQEEKKPVIVEHSPTKVNDKSEVPEKISAGLVIVKENAVPENSSPLLSLESKPEKATELKKDTIAVVASSPEKQQKITIVLPKEELSPTKGNDKSEVAKPLTASSVTLNANAVSEDSSPLLSLESKPEKVIIQAPLQTPVLPELSTKVQKQSVQILESPTIIESKFESKIPVEKLEPCDQYPASSSSVQKETEAQKTELIAAKPASEGNILNKEPQSLLENKNKEAIKLDTMTENNAENSSILSNRKTKPKQKPHHHRPRPKPRPSKKPTNQKPAASTISASSTPIAAEATTSASTSSKVPQT